MNVDEIPKKQKSKILDSNKTWLITPKYYNAIKTKYSGIPLGPIDIKKTIEKIKET